MTDLIFAASSCKNELPVCIIRAILFFEQGIMIDFNLLMKPITKIYIDTLLI